jgi:hypothetical protein
MHSDTIRQQMDLISQRQREFCEADLNKMRRYMEEGQAAGIRLSYDDLAQLAIMFANEKDEEFFRFLMQNYRAFRAGETYVPPSAMIVTTQDQLIGIAIVLGIGLVWVWVAVSPWTIDQPTAA